MALKPIHPQLLLLQDMKVVYFYHTSKPRCSSGLRIKKVHLTVTVMYPQDAIIHGRPSFLYRNKVISVR